jgi:hypothetical protein
MHYLYYYHFQLRRKGPVVATEFIGQPGIKHVMQPEGSDLCFAAIVSSLADQRPVDQVHQALVDGRISRENGWTLCPPEDQELQLAGDEVLKLEPFVGFSSERFMAAISERFEAHKPVALLYKKDNDEPEDSHWILLTGQYLVDGEVQLVGVMDSMQQRRTQVAPSEIADMIERTIEFNGGVYACALSVEQAT